MFHSIFVSRWAEAEKSPHVVRTGLVVAALLMADRRGAARPGFLPLSNAKGQSFFTLTSA